MTSQKQIDMSDISVDIVRHIGPTGEVYATAWASEHDEDGNTTPVIIKIAGPLDQHEVAAFRASGDFDGDDGMLAWANTEQWSQEEHIRP